jgi:hypothetical protein
MFFKLLDSYSRARYRCFVAEMFLNRAATEYLVCFRPTEENRDSADRFAFRYLHIDLRQVKKAAEKNALPTSIQEDADKELRSLNQANRPE